MYSCSRKYFLSRWTFISLDFGIQKIFWKKNLHIKNSSHNSVISRNQPQLSWIHNKKYFSCYLVVRSINNVSKHDIFTNKHILTTIRIQKNNNPLRRRLFSKYTPQHLFTVGQLGRIVLETPNIFSPFHENEATYRTFLH